VGWLMRNFLMHSEWSKSLKRRINLLSFR